MAYPLIWNGWLTVLDGAGPSTAMMTCGAATVKLIEAVGDRAERVDRQRVSMAEDHVRDAKRPG